MEEKLTFDEREIANLLRGEILKNSETFVKAPERKFSMADFELMSVNEKALNKETQTYKSPIFSMNEDEILAFVEEFDVAELATLSTAELNYIGEVLGVSPEILVESA